MSGSPLDDVTPDEAVARAEWMQRKQATYEDRIVRLVTKELGQEGQLPAMRRFAKDTWDDPNLHFGVFQEFFPFFPVWLMARHVPYVFKDLTFSTFYNKFTKTRVFQTYMEARSDLSPDWEGPTGLVFTWPKVKGGRGAMIVHDCSVALQGRWCQVAVRGTTYTLERLTDFMARVRSDSAEYKGA